LHSPVSSSSTVSTPVPTLHHSTCESDLSKPLSPSRSNSLILLQPSKGIRASFNISPAISRCLVLSHTVSHCLAPSRVVSRSFLPDAAVRSLCEIWNPHDIFADFLMQACLMTLPSPSRSYAVVSFPFHGLSSSSVFIFTYILTVTVDHTVPATLCSNDNILSGSRIQI